MITYLVSKQIEDVTAILKHLSVYRGHRMVTEELNDRFEYGDVDCHVSWKVSHTSINDENHYDYALLYYSGVRTFDGVLDGGIDVCAVVFCQDLNETDGDYSNCGVRYVSWSNASYKLIVILFILCAGIPRMTRSNGRMKSKRLQSVQILPCQIPPSSIQPRY